MSGRIVVPIALCNATLTQSCWLSIGAQRLKRVRRVPLATSMGDLLWISPSMVGCVFLAGGHVRLLGFGAARQWPRTGIFRHCPLEVCMAGSESQSDPCAAADCPSPLPLPNRIVGPRTIGIASASTCSARVADPDLLRRLRLRIEGLLHGGHATGLCDVSAPSKARQALLRTAL